MKCFVKVLCGLTIVIITAGVSTAQNYKIKQSTSMAGMSGHEMTSTVYVKGSRKRTESAMPGMGAAIATLEQCDLNRTLQINDKKKIYYVLPTTTAATTPAAKGASRTAAAAPKTTKGGTITQTSVITDTGERKQMFGLTARHIKTSMTMKSSPDACNKNDMSMETDGWYVDLPLFSCPAPIPHNPYGGGQPARSGCEDTYVVRSSGLAKLGFPLEMTQTMKSGEGDGTSFSQTISTIEFSKAALDDTLFNVPADYRAAASSAELYGMPDMMTMMSGQVNPIEYGAANSEQMPVSGKPAPKRAGTIRIGVMMPSNRSGEPTISLSLLQDFLTSQLSSAKIEALKVTSEADARGMMCDYILTSDISKLKQSTAGKIGGMFGGVTGAPTAGKFDAAVEYRLMPLADGKTPMQNKASAKTETEAQRAAESVLAMEAQAVKSSLGQ